MLRTHERNPKAKAVETAVEVYNDNNVLIRIVASARLDGFADEVDLLDGSSARNVDLVPLRIRGVEAAWTEGEGETVFVWDCRNELGGVVKEGAYRIDIKQADAFGNTNIISRIVNIKDMKAA